jgi:N-acyl-D-aspartate/D-glutamate deacylase
LQSIITILETNKTPQNQASSSVSRRKALKNISLVSSALLTTPHIVFGRDESQTTYKMVIKNGKVFTNNQLKPLYVGVTWDNKLKISAEAISGKTEIDASGKIVSPGFIDILADNAGSPETTYRTFEKYKLTDGATTVLQMHGGAAYPAQFHAKFDPLPHYVNYGVGVFVMILRLRFAALADRLKYTEKGLAEGAIGVCHSIEYQPTPYNELLEYAKLAKKYNRPYFLHLRYSAQETELDGVKEAIKLAQDSGARIHIDHLHSTGGTFNMPKALELIQNANNLGLEITTCVYPYSYWATYLISKRFDPGWEQRFKLKPEDLTVVGTGEKLNQAKFNAYRNRAGLLVAVPEGTMPMEKTVDLALQTDFCMIGSDGGIEHEPKANNHPRGAGCFATAVRHGMKIGMSMEKTLSKVTTLPAKLMRGAMDDRGVIADGKIADLTIFDPKTINGKASVANPNQFSEGIDYVILNGELVYQDKKILKSNGKAIRY